jgi:hypothetical protein
MKDSKKRAKIAASILAFALPTVVVGGIGAYENKQAQAIEETAFAPVAVLRQGSKGS